MRFADGRYLYWIGFNHWAVECVVSKQDQMIKMAVVKDKEIHTKQGSEESGKDSVNLSKLACRLTKKVFTLMV